MTGLTRTADHRYRWADGPFVPGATSVIRALDKGWRFESWLKDQVAYSAVHNMTFLSGLIEKGGEKAAAAWLAKLPDFERDTAASLGSGVHDIADKVAKGGKPTVPAEQVPFVRAELRFLKEHTPTKRRTEVMVYSEQGYGTTLDELCFMDGATCLIERKTGRNVYEEVRMQIAAQTRADFIGRPDDPRKYRMPKVDRYFVLHLRPDQYASGYRLIEYDVNDADYDAFLACLRLTAWRSSLNGNGT